MNRSKINLPKQNRSRRKEEDRRREQISRLRQGDGGKAKQDSQMAATKRHSGQLQTPVPSQKHEKSRKNSLVRVRTSFVTSLETAETHASVQGDTHAQQRHTKILSFNLYFIFS